MRKKFILWDYVLWVQVQPALFKNGNLLAAIEEERLSRKKNDNRFQI